MNSLASLQTQWDTRGSKWDLALRWTDDFTDSEEFQRQFREFVSNEQQGFENVYSLTLNCCPLKGKGTELQSLMKQLPNITILILNYSEVATADFRRARKAIKPEFLRVVVLNIANPSQDLLREFVGFVSTLTGLTKLDFSASADSLEITKKLLGALEGHYNLTELSLSKTSYGEDLVIDDGFISALCEVIRTCRMLSVVTVNLGAYSLENESIDLLLGAVAEHEYIRTFSFNKEADKFWPVLRTSAETQLRNVLRNIYNVSYLMSITKLVFIGDGAVGKSSTMRTILGEAFFASHDSTLVLDLNSFAKLDVINLSFKKVDGNDFVRFQYYFALQTQLSSDIKPVSKLELDPSRYNFKFEQEVAQEVLQEDYFQQLLRTGQATTHDMDHLMQVFDFGGQEIFYSLHHLLLTNSGIHMLVFNMEQVDTSHMQRVRFWMESLLLNAPSSMVIIVGTHFESLRLRSASSGTNVEDLLKTVNQTVEDTHHACSGRLQIVKNGRLSYFPLANSDGPGSAEAESIVNGVVRAITGAAGFDTAVLRMMISGAEHMFMGNLLRNVKHMRRDKFFEAAEDAGFKGEEVEDMLEKYTKAGLVLYFPDVAPEGNESNNIVVLSPKWLTSALAKIIFDKFLHHLRRQPPTELREDNETYLKTGVISKALLDFFWAEYTDEKEFLLECSIKMLVLVRFSYGRKEEYLVPSMLPQNPVDNVGVPLNIPTEFHCAIYFKKYMPLGFFPRIVSVFVEIAKCSESSSRPLLSGSFCRFIIDASFVISLVVNHANNLVSIRLETDQTGLPKLLNMTQSVVTKVRNSVYATNLDVVGLALPTKLPDENRQPGVKIADIQNSGNKLFFQDHINQGTVDSNRFLSFQIPQKPRPKEHFDLFLSHAWGHDGEAHEEVVKIEKLLAEQRLKCWIDERYMRGNIDFDMLHGLRSSSAYVLFLTDHFITRLENQNNNLAKEFFMIRDAKKRGESVFLVALEPHLIRKANWPPFSLLTFNFGEEPVFDFSSANAIEQNITAFKDAVKEKGNLESAPLFVPKTKRRGCVVA